MNDASGMGGEVATLRDPDEASLRANHAILKARMTVEADNPHVYEQDGRAVTRVPLVMGRDGSFVVVGVGRPSGDQGWQAGHDTMLLGASSLLPPDQPLRHYWLYFHAPQVDGDGSVRQRVSGSSDDKVERLIGAMRGIAGLDPRVTGYPEGQTPVDIARRAIEDFETPVVEASVLPAADIRDRSESQPGLQGEVATFRQDRLRPGLVGGVREADATDAAHPDPVQADAFPQQQGTLREADPVQGPVDVHGRQHDGKVQI